MNTMLNMQSISTEVDFEPKSNLINHNKELLLILHTASVEKEKRFLAGMKTTFAENIAEAKDIILSKKISFDAIICDAELNKKSITDLTGFLNSRKINTPFLLLDFHHKTDAKAILSNLKGVDDLITSNITAKEFNSKIEILKKYKFFHCKMPYKPELVNDTALNYSDLNYQYILKRTLDVVLSSALLIFVSPLILSIAVAIKLESKGPVFYTSLRAGRWYKVFTFFKFRTMVVNADSMIADMKYVNEYKDFNTFFFFKLKDDPRVTRVGKFLRRTSLDELPQLINVLKGDMSIVGNRPLPLYEAQTITVDKSAKRFFATAGMTGLWQVTGRSNLNLTADERIAMDINYADNSSFLFDLKILLKTPKELINKSNV